MPEDGFVAMTFRTTAITKEGEVDRKEKRLCSSDDRLKRLPSMRERMPSLSEEKSKAISDDRVAVPSHACVSTVRMSLLACK